MKITKLLTITAGNAIDQLTGLCLMAGPWNVIAMSQEPTAATAATISANMANVSGATGVVVAGRGGFVRHNTRVLIK